MAERTRLVRACLVMEIRRPGGVAERRTRVTLQAKHIEVAGFEQVRIGRAVR